MAFKKARVTLEDGRTAIVTVEVADAAPAAVPSNKGGMLDRALSLLPVAGGVVGGIAGGAVGGPPGAVGGAALGGASGESFKQLGRRALDLDVPKTPFEAAKRIGIEGATQGAGEAVGLGVVGPVARGVGRVLKKPAGQLFQIITKMKPEDAATLFKNPGAIMPGTMDKARKAWKTTADKLGISVDDVSPEMINILKGDAKSMVFDTYEKIVAGKAVSAKETQLAKQALDIAVMPVAKTVRKNPLVSTLTKIRGTFTDRIAKESPEMAAANKQYGIAATGKKFRSLFPTNTTGDPAYFRSSGVPSLIGLAGAARGEPGEGALQGLAYGAITSPLAIGSMISGAGVGRKLLPYIRRPITAAASDLMKKYLEGQ